MADVDGVEGEAFTMGAEASWEPKLHGNKAAKHDAQVAIEKELSMIVHVCATIDFTKATICKMEMIAQRTSSVLFSLEDTLKIDHVALEWLKLRKGQKLVKLLREVDE